MEKLLIDGWTPTAEKLPDEDGDYLITIAAGTVTDVGIATVNQVLTANFSLEDGESKAFQTWGYGDVFLNKEVIAWMPMPEPYDEERT